MMAEVVENVKEAQAMLREQTLAERSQKVTDNISDMKVRVVCKHCPRQRSRINDLSDQGRQRFFGELNNIESGVHNMEIALSMNFWVS